MRKANLQLAGEIGNELVEGSGPTENVVNNDFGASFGIKDNSTRTGQLFPSGIKIMYKHDKNNRTIDRSERHNSISVL